MPSPFARPRRVRIDSQNWVVSRASQPPRVHRLGKPALGASLVFDEEKAAQRPSRFERVISDFLCERHVSWMLRELDVNVVLDVGANKGQYAQALRRNGYRGRIVSFEPLPNFVAELRALSADDPDWLIVDAALGDESGTAEINVVDGAMSSLLPSSEFGQEWSHKLRETTPQTIRIERLQDVFAGVVEGVADPRVYLKLDTQGYDLEAFRGAGDLISELMGMQSEVSMVPIYEGMPRFAEQLGIYEAAGFETTGLFQVSRDKRTLRVIEFDLVMIGPAGLAARRQASSN